MGELYRDAILFNDSFRYKGHAVIPASTSLPDHWTMDTGSFSTSNGYALIVEQPGEMLWDGDSLHDLASEHYDDPSDNANFSLTFNFRPVPDLKFEIRGRRTAGDTYIALEIDIENELIRLKEVNGGVTTVLESMSFVWNTTENIDPYPRTGLSGRSYPGYIAELRMYDDRIEGYINETPFLSGTSSLNQTAADFSLYVPEIWTGDRPTFYRFYAQVTMEYPDPQLENSTHPYVIKRKEIKAACEDPDEYTWTTFKTARYVYKKGLNYGGSEEYWASQGYPLREPKYELWYQNQ